MYEVYFTVEIDLISMHHAELHASSDKLVSSG